ncbi:hypothetical protein GMA92_12465 [Turicibacter sanguinis]|uniref:Uncharacterized protein n=1 Tax=Turicibacter sanguinis TaxID=154288 RepID=A0A9X4XI69_9FIRM|nr:hypothetical protein [Turicibacter sanguinis]KAB6698691.1 hypothetical protein GAZ90_21635 [Phocaeicola vulgatus]MCU7192571.1 hypothetical protein [Turicibacter sanguinis]MCU7203029.1 hypothetical protein [Turicibacter sanguinis]MDB8564590.1 hypothetical protein [Turicibacter sanguinis]MDB8576418.1 hypothetical protein [Turicibacter sanguinis]
MGYKPFLFWELSIAEIYDLIESYQRKQALETEKVKQQLKVDVTLNSILARQIGEYVACLFSKDSKLTPIQELFPGLFDEELSVDKIEEQESVELMLYKAKMDDFAFWHNAQLKEKGGTKDE